MKIGAVFPNTEISADPDIVAEFATTAESLGYNHLVTYDHVLGAGRGTWPDWDGSYDSENPFHETFVLFGYLAGLTSTIELFSAIWLYGSGTFTARTYRCDKADLGRHW